jgi:hypothetical protein
MSSTTTTSTTGHFNQEFEDFKIGNRRLGQAGLLDLTTTILAYLENYQSGDQFHHTMVSAFGSTGTLKDLYRFLVPYSDDKYHFSNLVVFGPRNVSDDDRVGSIKISFLEEKKAVKTLLDRLVKQLDHIVRVQLFHNDDSDTWDASKVECKRVASEHLSTFAEGLARFWHKFVTEDILIIEDERGYLHPKTSQSPLISDWMNAVSSAVDESKAESEKKFRERSSSIGTKGKEKVVEKKGTPAFAKSAIQPFASAPKVSPWAAGIQKNKEAAEKKLEEDQEEDQAEEVPVKQEKKDDGFRPVRQHQKKERTGPNVSVFVGGKRVQLDPETVAQLTEKAAQTQTVRVDRKEEKKGGRPQQKRKEPEADA